MVRSDLCSAGVAFSIDPDSGFKNIIVINGSWGLGELVVQGCIIPDEILVFKPTLNNGYKPIIDKKIGDKKEQMVYGTNPDEKIKTIPVSKTKYNKFCINDEDILKLSRWTIEIEKYYTTLYEKWTPVDIEWAIDGITKKLFIVQARPETVHSNIKKNIIEEYKIRRGDNIPVIDGIAVGNKISSGKVKIIHSLDNRIHDQDNSIYDRISNIDFNKGDVLVTDMTDPDWEPIMIKASAVITNRGGRVCHASIIARELGINAVVGLLAASRKIDIYGYLMKFTNIIFLYMTF
jgi:pyruvate,water dikinase